METREKNGRRAANTVTDSHTHTESFHSPLRSESPLRSDEPDPPFSTPESSPCKAIVPIDAKYARPLDNRKPPTAPAAAADHRRAAAPAAAEPQRKQEAKPPVVMYNRAVREDAAAVVAKVGPPGGGVAGGGGGGLEDGGGRGGGGRTERAVTTILRRSRREELVKRVALGFRVCELVFCLVSFSVMAADRTQGWSGDSFDRYREYRYCFAVAIVAFVYSGFQAYELAYHLATGKLVICHHLRHHFDFFMDQVLAYLLLSASSAAATRVDDWQSNWGKDEFTEMASASIAMSFLAFAAFALSSIISGYELCTRDMT